MSFVVPRHSSHIQHPIITAPCADAECCTGNGITGCTGQCGPFGQLYHFPCDILHPHPARAMRPTDVTPSIIRFDPNDAGVSYIASEYVFEVPCEEGASWPGSITWPNCIVERCMGTSQPSITNFTSTDNGNVKVGEKVNYQCNVNTHPGQVQCFYSFIVHINIIPPLTGTWCI